MRFQHSVNDLFRKNDSRDLKQIHGALLKADMPDPQPQQSIQWTKPLFPILIAFLVFFASCIHSTPAHAEIKDSDAIKAIIGEAENQGYEGMLAVACAIRNRGTLKGVYGLNAPRVKNYKFSHKIHRQAFLAWSESEKHDITHGATHWENIKAFGCPSWVKNCIETFHYKDHVFYKEVV